MTGLQTNIHRNGQRYTSLKDKDYILLTGLILVTLTSVYYFPSFLNRIIFLMILAAVYRTKCNYVYLVWFFIINNAPGRLFSAGAFDAQRLPLYPVISGVSISFQELFILLYLFKYLSLKIKPEFIFKKEFSWYFLYGIFVVGYSFLLGMNFDDIVRTYRIFLSWSLVFIIPAYVRDRTILIRVCLLLFPIVFFALLSQIYSYYTGNYLDMYLRGYQSLFLEVSKEEAARSISAMFVTLFCVITALYFFSVYKSEINKNYLGIVCFTGCFTIFLTATRGWFIAISVLIVGCFFLSGLNKEMRKWIRLILLATLVFWIANSQFSLIEKQVHGAFQRYTTINAFIQGDLTAEGTLKRLDVRGPKVMSKFWGSPVLGWGFSNDYYRYQDGHVGHHNILLNIGIVGYVFVNLIFIRFLVKIWHLSKNRMVKAYEGNAPLIFVLGLIVIYIIHSSSTQAWGYFEGIEPKLFYGFLFSAAHVVLYSKLRDLPR